MAEGKGTTPEDKGTAPEGAAPESAAPEGTGAPADAAAPEGSKPAEGAAPDGAASDGEAAAEAFVPELGQYQVLVGIGGLRDGVPWPKVGELIELPTDEAAGYVLAGYVKIPEGN